MSQKPIRNGATDLQQFLEMKHGLPRSPLSLITNFLSNIDFFARYGNNIVGVSGTLGNDIRRRNSMSDIFSVEFRYDFQPPNGENCLFLMGSLWKSFWH